MTGLKHPHFHTIKKKVLFQLRHVTKKNIDMNDLFSLTLLPFTQESQLLILSLYIPAPPYPPPPPTLHLPISPPFSPPTHMRAPPGHPR